MTAWRERPGRLLGALLAVLSLLLLAGTTGAVAASESGPVEHRTLFAFADREIHESSGLVDTGDVVYTVNDSGSGPTLYAVDPRTGRTSGVTTYTDEDVEDVEAIAPGPEGTVWVGDIGDNFERRDEVWVYRVTPGRTGAPRFGLTYPGGARDAETLLSHPRTGRLFVVSKTVFGGVVYAAPRRLEPGETHRLRRFAQVPGFLTDGAFTPDGRHVVLRGYGGASVFTFPGFELRGSVILPRQEQGEGLSVGPDGRVLLSSEGIGAEVLQVELPPGLTAREAGRSGSPGVEQPSATPSRSGADDPPAEQPGSAGTTTSWGWAALAAMVAGLATVGLVLRSLRRR